MIKVFFGAALPKRDLIRVLRQRAKETKEQLNSLEIQCELTNQFAEAMGRPWEGFFWELTCNHGIKQSKANLEWLEQAIEQIEALDDSVLAASHSEGRFTDVRKAVEMLEELHALHLAGETKLRAVNGETSA